MTQAKVTFEAFLTSYPPPAGTAPRLLAAMEKMVKACERYGGFNPHDPGMLLEYRNGLTGDEATDFGLLTPFLMRYIALYYPRDTLAGVRPDDLRPSITKALMAEQKAASTAGQYAKAIRRTLLWLAANADPPETLHERARLEMALRGDCTVAVSAWNAYARLHTWHPEWPWDSSWDGLLENRFATGARPAARRLAFPQAATLMQSLRDHELNPLQLATLRWGDFLRDVSGVHILLTEQEEDGAGGHREVTRRVNVSDYLFDTLKDAVKPPGPEEPFFAVAGGGAFTAREITAILRQVDTDGTVEGENGEGVQSPPKLTPEQVAELAAFVRRGPPPLPGAGQKEDDHDNE